MHKESFSKGVIYTLISAAGIALTGLFGKLGAAEFSLDALIFWRYTAAFLLCMITLWISGRLYHVLSFSHLKLHVLRAFFVLGAQYSFYYYIQRDTLLNGLTLLSLGPLSIPLIEWVVTRHRIGKSTWIGLGISFLGMLLILQPGAGVFSVLSVMGILAGLCQGCSQVVFGLSVKNETPGMGILYLFFLCMLLSGIPYLYFGSSLESTTSSGIYPVLLIAILAVASMLSQFTRAAAYQHGTPARLSTFLYFSILLGGLSDWLIFHKAPNIFSLIGAVLIVMGGVLKIYLRSIILRKK